MENLPKAVVEKSDEVSNSTHDLPSTNMGPELHSEDLIDNEKITIRQSAILQRIRQSGNCHFKTLQDYFPQISERTLRYDLQDLMEKRLIDRTGGGPVTSYSAREEIVLGYPQKTT